MDIVATAAGAATLLFPSISHVAGAAAVSAFRWWMDRKFYRLRVVIADSDTLQALAACENERWEVLPFTELAKVYMTEADSEKLDRMMEIRREPYVSACTNVIRSVVDRYLRGRSVGGKKTYIGFTDLSALAMLGPMKRSHILAVVPDAETFQKRAPEKQIEALSLRLALRERKRAPWRVLEYGGDVGLLKLSK